MCKHSLLVAEKMVGFHEISVFNCFQRGKYRSRLLGRIGSLSKRTLNDINGKV